MVRVPDVFAVRCDQCALQTSWKDTPQEAEDLWAERSNLWRAGAQRQGELQAKPRARRVGVTRKGAAGGA